MGSSAPVSGSLRATSRARLSVSSCRVHGSRGSALGCSHARHLHTPLQRDRPVPCDASSWSRRIGRCLRTAADAVVHVGQVSGFLTAPAAGVRHLHAESHPFLPVFRASAPSPHPPAPARTLGTTLGGRGDARRPSLPGGCVVNRGLRRHSLQAGEGAAVLVRGRPPSEAAPGSGPMPRRHIRI